MHRNIPSHITKYYEALWCIGDSRLKIDSIIHENQKLLSAKVYSSDRSKTYTVQYNPDNRSIMSNDNSSYWKWELGYPSIALLLFLDILDYRSDYGEALSDIEWKKINTENNNNFDTTQLQVEQQLVSQGIDIDSLHGYCDELKQQIITCNFSHLWNKQQPAHVIV